MRRMLVAELAILADLQAIRIVLLVLVGLVVAVLADGTGQRDRVAVPLLHPLCTPYSRNIDRWNVTKIIYHTCRGVSI